MIDFTFRMCSGLAIDWSTAEAQSDMRIKRYNKWGIKCMPTGITQLLTACIASYQISKIWMRFR